MAKITQPKVDVNVKYDTSQQIQLAKEAPGLARQLVAAVQIKDQKTMDRAAELVKAAEAWLEGVNAILDPVREATHAAWKAAIKAQNDFTADVEPVYRALKQAMNRFLAKQQDDARKKQLEAEEAQRRLNEKTARENAALAKKAGADKETIEEVRSNALATPAPIVKPKAAAPAGFSQPRMLYYGKITNMRAFLAGLLEDKTLFTTVTNSANVRDALEGELRKLATMQKEAFAVSGCALEKKPAGTGS